MPSSNIFPQHPVFRPFPRIILVPNPGAGNEILYACPANYRLEILGIHFILTTSVAVANRNVDLIIGTGAVDLLRFDFNILHPASLPYGYHLVPGQIQGIFTIGLDRWCPAPPLILLTTGMAIQTNTLNIQAADAFTFIYIYAFAFPDLVNMAPA